VARYRVEIADANAHLFRVTLTLARPAAAQGLSLPVWVPGSYLVREFSRHVSALAARQGARAVALVQHDKSRWLAACEGRTALVVSYLVYAFDRSARGAFLDAERGFFNGSSLFLRAEGREAEPQQLQLGRLPAGWQVATAMAALGPRRFAAADYDELIDHPLALGRLWRGRFRCAGVEHAIAVGGAWPSFDAARLLRDIARVCAAQLHFWHGAGRAPFGNYLFLLQLADEGHGGLEHRASAVLLAARGDLPRSGAAETTDAYVDLLGLVSHEYFHTWNVKRMKPRELVAPDLGRETYTRLLWFFEGFTSYYEDLLLLRAGLIDRGRYLRLLARPVNALLGSPGRAVQSVAAASFDAWIKYYRSDENTLNATVSYYTKGALVALLCDLWLRAHGQATLDDVMRRLWRASARGAIGEDEITGALAAAGGEKLRRQLQAWVHGTDELPLEAMLAAAGVAWHEEPVPLAAQLGLKISEGPVSGVHVRQVLRGSAAEAAGLAAGDELLAVDGWRIRRLDDARQWLAVGRSFEVLAVRDQRVRELRLKLPAAPAAPSVVLLVDEQADAAALALRRAWLGS
jgi:predicted metalloprotease with PDZ domain